MYLTCNQQDNNIINMKNPQQPPLSIVLLLALLFVPTVNYTGVNHIGDDVSPPSQAARFLIERIRITVPNGDIPALTDPLFAGHWIDANIKPFYPATKPVLIETKSGFMVNLYTAFGYSPANANFRLSNLNAGMFQKATGRRPSGGDLPNYRSNPSNSLAYIGGLMKKVNSGSWGRKFEENFGLFRPDFTQVIIVGHMQQQQCQPDNEEFLNEFQDEGQETKLSYTNCALSKKEKINWTDDLHRKFVQAVEKLGGVDKATPNRILELMKVDNLTRDHVASHLQKYRISLKSNKSHAICLVDASRNYIYNPEASTSNVPTSNELASSSSSQGYSMKAVANEDFSKYRCGQNQGDFIQHSATEAPVFYNFEINQSSGVQYSSNSFIWQNPSQIDNGQNSGTLNNQSITPDITNQDGNGNNDPQTSVGDSPFDPIMSLISEWPIWSPERMADEPMQMNPQGPNFNNTPDLPNQDGNRDRFQISEHDREQPMFTEHRPKILKVYQRRSKQVVFENNVSSLEE